jgi:hypothetical protein
MPSQTCLVGPHAKQQQDEEAQGIRKEKRQSTMILNCLSIKMKSIGSH